MSRSRCPVLVSARLTLSSLILLRVMIILSRLIRTGLVTLSLWVVVLRRNRMIRLLLLSLSRLLCTLIGIPRK